jgi:hypothetical protein
MAGQNHRRRQTCFPIQLLGGFVFGISLMAWLTRPSFTSLQDGREVSLVASAEVAAASAASALSLQQEREQQQQQQQPREEDLKQQVALLRAREAMKRVPGGQRSFARRGVNRPGRLRPVVTSPTPAPAPPSPVPTPVLGEDDPEHVDKSGDSGSSGDGLAVVSDAPVPSDAAASGSPSPAPPAQPGADIFRALAGAAATMAHEVPPALAGCLASRPADGRPLRVFITYGDNAYARARERLAAQAHGLGAFDCALFYTPGDVDTAFDSANAGILRQLRGGGVSFFWAPCDFTISAAPQLPP